MLGPGPFFLKGVLIRDKLLGIRRRQATRKSLLPATAGETERMAKEKEKNPNAAAPAPALGSLGCAGVGGQLSPTSPETQV